MPRRWERRARADAPHAPGGRRSCVQCVRRGGLLFLQALPSAPCPAGGRAAGSQAPRGTARPPGMPGYPAAVRRGRDDAGAAARGGASEHPAVACDRIVRRGGTRLRHRKIRKPATSTVSAVRTPQEKHWGWRGVRLRFRHPGRTTQRPGKPARAPFRTSRRRSRRPRPLPAPPRRKTRCWAAPAAAAGALLLARRWGSPLPRRSRAGRRRWAPPACAAPQRATRKARTLRRALPRLRNAARLLDSTARAAATRARASRTRLGCSCATGRGRRAAPQPLFRALAEERV